MWCINTLNLKNNYYGGYYMVEKKGADEQYCASCGAVVKKEAEICPKCGVRINKKSSEKKSKTTAGILAILLGSFGAHKFYLGHPGIGILYLCFCWLYIPGILGIIEGIIILTKSDEDFEEIYVKNKKSMF
jgi:TM2 domain-containing membrane protein YozV